MKITTLIIASALIIASVTNLNAENNKITHQDQEVKLPEEPYVDDVPFDTKAVVEALENNKDKKQQPTTEVSLPEEEYVDDVNIDTRQVVLEHYMNAKEITKVITTTIKKSLRDFSDKGYIKHNQLNLVKLCVDLLTEDKSYDVCLPEEEYVDDVPFNTQEVVESIR
ncbi:MAG: hypothetical protein ACQESZ_08160 [Bacteroidota bacterium]